MVGRGLTQVTASAVADASDGGDASATAVASGDTPTSAEASLASRTQLRHVHF